MDTFTKALLSACTTLASEEGITDEEKVAVRANEIYTDAQNEEPVTEVGKKARQQAKDVVAVEATNNVPSPYGGAPKFDYDGLYDKTVTPSVGEIWKLIGENSDSLALTASVPSKELVQARKDAFEKISIGAFNILNKNGVGMSKYGYLFKDLKDTIAMLESLMGEQVTGHKLEIESRTLGVKNPGTGKFDANYATYEALLATRERIKTETGGNDEDYFMITPKE